MPEPPSHLVTEDDYFAAVQRIADGAHTLDDLNLVLAWEHRAIDQHLQATEAIRRTIEKLQSQLGQ